MNTNEPVARLQGLTKVFDSCTALAQVDLTIQAGRIIGLLGANGAGKSTLLRHLVGLYLPDSGTCTTFGCSCAELGPDQLSRIGYVHQDGELLDWMRAGQLIRYVAAYYPEWNEEVEQAFLRDFEVPLDRRVGALSPGQRQRLAILLAIGFEPDLLILDEPAAGLDPVARAKFLDLLVSMIQDQTRTIIISSHRPYPDASVSNTPWSRRCVGLKPTCSPHQRLTSSAASSMDSIPRSRGVSSARKCGRHRSSGSWETLGGSTYRR